MKSNNRTQLILTMVFVLFTALSISARAIKPADSTVTLRIDMNNTAQIIDNFGSSGCWFSEGIGKYWPAEKKEKIAQLLFSRQISKTGQPLGIGLSAWRFNIGAGTTEQGDSSGIVDFRKRTDCFLLPNGKYDWNKQAGYQFFLKKAHDYGVEKLIAFSNSPPVQFTKNGLGYKTEKNYESNLKDDAYDVYANFLAQVTKHFNKEGLHFDYVSPVNEPQWDWSKKYKEADQEGSPWKNEEIFKITKALNTALDKENLTSKILITEAGMLNYLYGGKNGASNQIQSFFKSDSPFYTGNLSHVPKIVAGHSYFTESNDTTLVAVRKQLADTAKQYGVDYWQTEYSMLADGFREGSKEKRSGIDCALFLSKVIHTDLTIGNAAAWQFWNSYEPGKADFDTRYYLIALQPEADFKNGEFSETKNLWALGSFSRFIRPGMQRINTDQLNDKKSIVNNKNLMVSAYTDKNNKLVIVGINYGTKAIEVNLDLKNSKKKYKKAISYLTASGADENMKASAVEPYSGKITLPPRSISTLIVD